MINEWRVNTRKIASASARRVASAVRVQNPGGNLIDGGTHIESVVGCLCCVVDSYTGLR